MDEKLRALLTSMLIGLVGDYIETMKFVAQKQIISSRNPQSWMVDKAYNSMFQNVPQFASQAANPVPVQGAGLDIASIMQALTQPQAGQPAVAAPAAPQTIQHNGQTYVLQTP
tara:strand:+ start:83 stop:421 length:339 start_codon:yes stop_codon:yes gene_type:complete